MAAGGAALKARGYPPICCANRFPPRPLRGACASLRRPWQPRRRPPST